MSASQPPPSAQIPGRSSSSGLYLAGIIILALLAVGLFVWKSKQTASTETIQTATLAPTAAAPPPPPPPLYAPPPPPKIEEEPDAGVDAGKQQPIAKGTGGAALPAPGPCGGKCVGASTAALSEKLRGTAQSAQGCYNRALRTGEASGSLTVSVQVGPNGSVCGASISNDTVNSGEISSCVLSKFRGAQFPAPEGGCLTANIPISFKIKQ